MTKDIVKIELKADVNEVVHSCVRMFGEARAEEVLEQLYKGNKLKKALAFLEKIELAQEYKNENKVDVEEVKEMLQIEVNEKGEEIMTKKMKVIKEEELDMHVDNDGIDALEDTRVVTSDHGIDNTENNLEWWMLHAKRSEKIPVEFRECFKHFDKGVYKGTIRNVYDFFKNGKPRVVVNVNLEPIYSTAEHRGYVIKNCPVFLTLEQFVSICNELGWDVDDTKGFIGKPVNVVIAYDETRKENTYFLQGKEK